jgi:hypothetical protein
LPISLPDARDQDIFEGLAKQAKSTKHFAWRSCALLVIDDGRASEAGNFA